MTRLHPFLIPAVLILALGVGWGLWQHYRAPAPLPPAPAQVAPGDAFLNAEASIAYYREALRREPDNADGWAALGQVLLQEARATGRETKYVPEAQAAIERALALDPEHFHARSLHASLLNTLHRFEDARDAAERLLARHPENAFAHGVLVDALVELGEYEAAVAAADRMVTLKPGLPAYSRVSYLRELHGDTGGAIQAMRLAADAGASGHTDRAWALQTLAGLYLDAGRPDTAAYVYQGLLDERPGYPWALGGLGRVALVRGYYAGAIRYFDAALAAAPLDVFHEGLAEAYALIGDAERAAGHLAAVRGGFADARAIGEDVDMEEADFMLDHGIEPARALEMAERQYRRRPGHLHALETYAWALHHNGRAAEALPHIRRAMRLSTGDAMVHLRAGHIYRAAAQPREAARQFRLALEHGVGRESPLAAAEAREMLAALGAPAQTASL